MPQRFDERRLTEYRVLSRKVGERIKQARTEDGFTQDDIARQLDRSVSWLSFIEKGTNMPNLMDLIAIANYLGRPIDFFLSDWNVISSFRAPKNSAEWRAMFPGEPDRANAHDSIDRAYRSAGEVMRARERIEVNVG